MLIIFEGTDTTVDPFHWKTLLTFSLSVLSAAFGMSRFFNVGPCRLVPYGKMNVGFLFLVISIATCLVGKGTIYYDSNLLTDRLGGKEAWRPIHFS